MPLIWVAGLAAATGAMIWNSIDDNIVDPITGTYQPRPFIGTGPALAFIAGAAVGIIAKKRGWL